MTRFSKADAVLTDVMQMRQAFAQREKDDAESNAERERGANRSNFLVGPSGLSFSPFPVRLVLV